jgi:hypothetical protein
VAAHCLAGAQQATTTFRATFEGAERELKAVQDAADHAHAWAMSEPLGPIFVPLSSRRRCYS